MLQKQNKTANSSCPGESKRKSEKVCRWDKRMFPVVHVILAKEFIIKCTNPNFRTSRRVHIILVYILWSFINLTLNKHSCERTFDFVSILYTKHIYKNFFRRRNEVFCLNVKYNLDQIWYFEIPDLIALFNRRFHPGLFFLPISHHQDYVINIHISINRTRRLNSIFICIFIIRGIFAK